MPEEVTIARGDGGLACLANAASKVEVLILDDFRNRPINPDAASDTLDVKQ